MRIDAIMRIDVEGGGGVEGADPHVDETLCR